MRLRRAQIKHVAGWAGGIVERGEPDYADGQLSGRLRAGENFVQTSTGRLQVRGGARVALTLTGNTIDSIVGVFPWSPTGGLVVAHSSAGSKHYAVAVLEDGSVALPVGAETEGGSTDDLDWNSADIVWPIAVELFETLFLADPAGAQVMRSAKLAGGSLVTADVEADLDGDTTNAGIKAQALAVYNSVLLVAGWEDESVGAEPSIVRHSFLAQDPATAAGWDRESFAIIGAKGQPVRAMQAGLGQCLVAKESELYRLTGNPDAVPGWQFGIQQVEATLGFGCVGPQALTFAEGRWWGVGQNGPWMYDGARVESLRSARSASWARIGTVGRSFVRYHPRRRAVLFGFDEPTAPVSGERASRLWAYDLRRGVWAPDYTSHRRFWMVNAIARTGVQLSTRIDNLTWQSAFGTFEPTAITFTFDPGNLQAQTEVWLEPQGESASLVRTLGANQRGARIDGLSPGRRYNVTLRHRTGDALTEFTAPVAMYTQVPAPRIAPNQSSSTFAVVMDRIGRVLQYNVTASNNNVPTTQTAPLNTGVSTIVLPSGSLVSPWEVVVNAATVAPDHPVGFDLSPVVVHRKAVATRVSTGRSARITQQFDPESWQETSIRVLFDHRVYGLVGSTRVEYRRLGDPLWTVASTQNGRELFDITIIGLAPGERYELRAIGPGSLGNPVIGYTKIPAPVASIATSGAPGSPSVDITARPGNGLTGFDMAIRNLGGTYDALFGSVPSGDVSYNSTAGACGVPDTYFVRARSTVWPAGLQYSDPVELTVADPCTT